MILKALAKKNEPKTYSFDSGKLFQEKDIEHFFGVVLMFFCDQC